MRHLFIATLFVAALALGAAVTHYYHLNGSDISVYTMNLPESEGDKDASKLTYGPSPSLANADFFEDVKNKFIDGGSNFIEADLSRMKLTVYQGGVPVKEVPVLTKGREGLWWQTPAGLYKIESKAKSHYSSFGHVYQPFSMAFQGNFFIHGIPSYKDGSKVSSQFSGGCIRLADEDAEAVYNLVTVGYPVLVFEKGFIPDTFAYEEASLNLSAESYLAADLKNNFVFASKEATTTKSVASLTKLLTALVASEYINLDKNIVIKESNLATTSIKRLKAGDTVSAYSLISPLLLESSNEAAEALASSLGRGYFISLMNKKAKAVGMNSTTFSDPSGRESYNISTAEDVFLLAKYIYLNRRFILNITSERVSGSAYENTFSGLQNFNLYKGDKEFIGGKIGKSTSAKETYVGVFEIKFNGEIRPIVIVVLGSEDIKSDVDTLRKYINDQYKREEG